MDPDSLSDALRSSMLPSDALRSSMLPSDALRSSMLPSDALRSSMLPSDLHMHSGQSSDARKARIETSDKTTIIDTILDCANSIDITHVELANEKIECELCELVKVIEYDKLYKIKITYMTEEYTYDEYSEIMNVFIISDLVPMIFEYLINMKEMNMVHLKDDETDTIDLFFPSYTVVYNCYGREGDVDTGMRKCTCPEKCTKAMQNKIVFSEYEEIFFDKDGVCKYCKLIYCNYANKFNDLDSSDNLEDIGIMFNILSSFVWPKN